MAAQDDSDGEPIPLGGLEGLHSPGSARPEAGATAVMAP